MRIQSALRASTILFIFALFLTGNAFAQSIEHLPDSIQADIEQWRARLLSSACIKVICDTEEIWERMYLLDDNGDPVVARRERFQVHSWMTAGLHWMTVFGYNENNVDTTTLYTQVLWDRETGIVRERFWQPDDEVYHVRKYHEKDPFGPEDAAVADAKGCVWGSVLKSWLAGDAELVNRGSSTRTIAFLRSANLAVVPPDPSQQGVWFDVFKEAPERDRKPAESRLYRRNDFLLLSRNDGGEPEVREWRTIVQTDPDEGGKRPTEITGIRRYEYSFFDQIPEVLVQNTRAFGRDVDDALDLLRDDSQTNSIKDE